MHNTKSILDSYPNLNSEEEDIRHSMSDQAEDALTWIKQSIVSQLQKMYGKNISSTTRTLIFIKACKIYIEMSDQIRNKMLKKANDLFSDLE